MLFSKSALGIHAIPASQKHANLQWRLRLGMILVALAFVSRTFGQDQPSDWQAQVRSFAEARDWDSALGIVDQAIARAPQDMDVRAWRARVLTWASRLADAEKEYLDILKFSERDPDNWMGL